MLSLFQKAVLGSLVGSAVLVSLVIAAKGSSTSASTPLVGGGLSTLSTPINTGGLAPGVLTTGDATVKVKPNIAIITVGAVAQANTAADAQSAIAARVDQILKRAKDLGIADKDTHNAGYQIQPQYASGPDKAPHITGYQATQQISLTFRNVDGLGRALDALVQSDGSNTLSIRLGLDDPKPAQADARRLAIEDAKSKADAMAKAAGVTLGRLIAVSDQTSSVPFDARGAQGPAAQLTTQIPVGDLDVIVHVQVQFEIH